MIPDMAVFTIVRTGIREAPLASTLFSWLNPIATTFDKK
jgi:hypothetical protein